MTTEATPRPWSFDGDGYAAHLFGADESRLDEDGELLEDDAALVVEAVNAYDRLRAIEAAARAYVEAADLATNADAFEALRAALREGTKA